MLKIILRSSQNHTEIWKHNYKRPYHKRIKNIPWLPSLISKGIMFSFKLFFSISCYFLHFIDWKISECLLSIFDRLTDVYNRDYTHKCIQPYHSYTTIAQLPYYSHTTIILHSYQDHTWSYHDQTKRESNNYARLYHDCTKIIQIQDAQSYHYRAICTIIHKGRQD